MPYRSQRAASPGATGVGVPLLATVLLLSIVGASGVASVPPAFGAPGSPGSPGEPWSLGPAGPARLAPAHPGVSVHPSSVVPAYGGGYAEPAPMGIADFGVTPLDYPYSYATNQWLGTVQIGSVKVSSGGGVGSNGILGFQLNVVLVLSTASGNLSYWVQNVVEIDSKTETIGFVNNIWNFSSPTAGLTPAELTGNGTVYDQSGFNYYAATDKTTGSGNGIALTLPATVQAKVTTADYLGLPEVTFLYDDGYGWATYDNVTFAHGAQWTDLGYIVDGYRYAPIANGIYTDGEWDFTGKGSDYTDLASNLTMSLQYWNGHNFQSPANAWNFGGNTGESMKSVVPRFLADPETGALVAHETNGSGGSLGPLYGASQVAQVEFDAPSVPSGIIQVGSGNYSYVGGLANLTLAPGSYRIQLWNAGTADGLLGWLNLSGGESDVVQLPVSYEHYPVRFHAEGLPAGTAWGVRFGGDLQSSTGAWQNFSVTNGSWAYAVSAVPGWSTGTYSAHVIVNGTAVAVLVTWTPFTYAIPFEPRGLPSGTFFTVNVTGVTELTGFAPNPVTVYLSNGTWSYNLTTVPWYAAEPSSGSLGVFGFSQPMTVQFGPAPSRIIGTVVPTDAQVSLDGQPVAVNASGGFATVVAPGPHNLSASAPNYVTDQLEVVTTAGNATDPPVHVVLAPVGSGGSVTPPPAPAPALSNAVILVLGAIVIGAVAVAGAALATRRTPPGRR